MTLELVKLLPSLLVEAATSWKLVALDQQTKLVGSDFTNYTIEPRRMARGPSNTFTL